MAREGIRKELVTDYYRRLKSFISLSSTRKTSKFHDSSREILEREGKIYRAFSSTVAVLLCYMSNSIETVTKQVAFYKGELRAIAEVAAAGNQTIQQFMQEAVREGIAEYKKNKTLPPAIDRIQ